MSVRRIVPARLRRRLAVAFVLVGGVSTGALAVGSYIAVRDARLDDSTSRAVDQSAFNLRFATTEQSPRALLAAYATRGEFCTLVLPAGRPPVRSGLSCPGPAQVPADLRRLVESGQLARTRVVVAGRREIVVGGRVPGRREAVYFFYDEQQVWDDLAELRTVLAGGWAALTLLAGLVGTFLARRTLAPVAQASGAARALAEGLLDTRLPVSGRDEFAAWAVSFNEMADALEQKIAALSAAQDRERRFTANVAHELRTPLTALVAEADLLVEQAGTLPRDARRLAEMLAADVARLRRLTEELLEISRLDAGSEATATELVDAAAVVDATLAAHGWREQVAVDAQDVVLETDRRRLERILANLVGNAVEHAGAGIRVRVAREAETALVEVSDDGPGIAADALPYVFERFFKADRSRAGGGSGLGLAIARENAVVLGGSLTAASVPGGGATFTLRLPVAKPLHGGEPGVAHLADDEGETTITEA
jgi:two-component system, OmpR family, sensor histidine kinase MtrB